MKCISWILTKFHCKNSCISQHFTYIFLKIWFTFITFFTNNLNNLSITFVIQITSWLQLPSPPNYLFAIHILTIPIIKLYSFLFFLQHCSYPKIIIFKHNISSVTPQLYFPLQTFSSSVFNIKFDLSGLFNFNAFAVLVFLPVSGLCLKNLLKWPL